MTDAATRRAYLDGLRGVAAFIVMMEHLSALFTVGTWTIGAGTIGDIATAALNFPFRAGTASVYVFFVISGIVIAGSASGGKPWPLSLVSRYLRLTIPMLAAGILAWALLNLLPGEMPRLAAFHPNHWTETMYQGGPPTLFEAIKEAIIEAYVAGKPQINPVLWSMRIELYGSLAIFTFYRFAPRRARLPALLAIAALVPVFGLWRYVAFPVGAALFERNKIAPMNWPAAWAIGSAAVGLGLCVVVNTSEARYATTLGSPYLGDAFDAGVLLDTVGGILIVAAAMSAKAARWALMTPIPLFLGRISYGLYLTHMPLFFTIGAGALLWLGYTPLVMVCVAGVSVAAALGLGYLTTLAVDEPAARSVRIRAYKPVNQLT